MLLNMVFCFDPDHFAILTSIMSDQKTEFIEKIDVLIESNRNPLTLWNLSVKCINCKCVRSQLMKGSD